MTRRTLVLILATAGFAAPFFAAPALAQPAVALVDAIPTLTAVGTAELRVAPDLAVVRFVVMTEEDGEDGAQEAMKVNTNKSWQVVQALQELGLAEREVEVGRVTLQPRYDFDVNPGRRTPQIVGYAAENRITVRTRKLEEVGRIIGAAVEAGANRVDSVEFTLENETPARREAMERASASARADAEAMARGLGVRLGRVVRVNADQHALPMPMFRAARAEMMSAASDAAPVPVNPGEVTVNAQVSVVFEVIP